MLGETNNQHAIDLALEPAFQLGCTTIDPKAREASCEGAKERIQPQNLKVLIALAQKRGSLVTRDELVRRCWDGRFIGDDVINRAISTLRQVADRLGGFEIETVPRAGYRLIESSPRRALRPKHLRAFIGLAAIVMLATILAWSSYHRRTLAPTIAVLPFSTVSSDPAERELAVAARDAVAQALSRSDFHVALPNRLLQPGDASSDFLVSADVSRNAARSAVAVNVVDAANGVIVYTHRFEAERADAGDLSERVGAQVAGTLGWTASLLLLERDHADPTIAASLFNSADYDDAYKLSLRYPTSPSVQFDLAYYAAYEILALPFDQRAAVAAVGEGAMQRSRALAPRFGGNEILWCLYHGRGRIKECDGHLRAGLRYDPEYPWLADYLAQRLKDVGRFAEALKFATASLNHDPYQMQKIGLMVRMLEATGDTGEARTLFERGKREWAGEPVLYWDRIYGMLDRGDLEALQSFLKSMPAEAAPAIQPAIAVLETVKAKSLSQAHELCPNDQVLSFTRDVCMLALARLGDVHAAMNLALGTYADRLGRTPAQEQRIWLYSGRYNDTDILMGDGAKPLRRDPRYLELAHRIGALDYWRSGQLPDFCQSPPQPDALCSQLGSRK